MSAYYGIINITKKHFVSHCWKDFPPGDSQLLAIFKLFDWNDDDIIMIGYYNFYSISLYVKGQWHYDSKTFDKFNQYRSEGFDLFLSFRKNKPKTYIYDGVEFYDYVINKIRARKCKFDDRFFFEYY